MYEHEHEHEHEYETDKAEQPLTTDEQRWSIWWDARPSASQTAAVRLLLTTDDYYRQEHTPQPLEEIGVSHGPSRTTD